MIPTYNCGDFFEHALRSVLDQDPGRDQMQIAVVDDGSTLRRHEEVIERLAPGRVELYHRSMNLGLACAWNECIARSRGRWIHILHQDDLVLPGFYDALSRAHTDPAVGAAFCRQIFIDDEGEHKYLSTLHQPTAGVIPRWLDTISRHQHIQCPSIVVRREVYEFLGGFSTSLCFALDWEMWVRIAADYPVWFEPEPLACYRWHSGNETTRLRNTNRDIADVRRAVRIIRRRLPAEQRDAAGSALLAHVRQTELAQTCAAFHAGELRSGLESFRRAMQCDRSLLFSSVGFSYSKWALKIWLGKLRPPAFGRSVQPSSRRAPPGSMTDVAS
jgi:glycosyltransferase involved in cell wall biosynthesis